MDTVYRRGIGEATNLVRAGRLGEATSLLRTLLRQSERPEARDDAPAFRHLDSLGDRLARQLQGVLGQPSQQFADTPSDLPDQVGDRPSGTARFLSARFGNHAGSRVYKLYVPSGYTGAAVPLIVMLHGCTQSPDDFAAGTRMNALAEEKTVLIAYPAQDAAANASRCWNWFNRADQSRDRGEPALIAGITRKIMQDYAIDPMRVYVAGLSAGGAAASVMGSTYPDLYAAVGVHSGLCCGAASDLPSAFAAMRQGAAGKPDTNRPAIPTIVFHGDADRTVNPANAMRVLEHAGGGTLDELRLSVEGGATANGRSYSRRLHSDAQGRRTLELWVVHGAGHAWFGGSPQGSYTDPKGPDASREMLRFFLEHPKA